MKMISDIFCCVWVKKPSTRAHVRTRPQGGPTILYETFLWKGTITFTVSKPGYGSIII